MSRVGPNLGATSSVRLGKLVSLIVPQIYHLSNENNIRPTSQSSTENEEIRCAQCYLVVVITIINHALQWSGMVKASSHKG